VDIAVILLQPAQYSSSSIFVSPLTSILISGSLSSEALWILQCVGQIVVVVAVIAVVPTYVMW